MQIAGYARPCPPTFLENSEPTLAIFGCSHQSTHKNKCFHPHTRQIADGESRIGTGSFGLRTQPIASDRSWPRPCKNAASDGNQLIKKAIQIQGLDFFFCGISQFKSKCKMEKSRQILKFYFDFNDCCRLWIFSLEVQNTD